MVAHEQDAPEDPVALLRQQLEETEGAVGEIAEPHLRAPLLARIAALYQDDDPELTARRADDALAQAEALENPYVRAFTLAEVSRALTTTDLARAGQAARSALRAAKVVPDMYSRTIALAEAAAALGTTDPERAERVLADAGQLADSACTCPRRCLLTAVLERMAVLDPDEAVQNVNLIPVPAAQGLILARAIPHLAAADPRQAVALVSHVPELHEQIKAWVGVCGALAEVDAGLAVHAAECAEADARFSHYPLVQLSAFTSLARSVHRIDPARARRLLAAAEAVFEQVEPSHSRSVEAAGLARAQARFDAERGMRTARQIVHPHPRALAFVLLAEDSRAEARA